MFVQVRFKNTGAIIIEQLLFSDTAAVSNSIGIAYDISPLQCKRCLFA